MERGRGIVRMPVGANGTSTVIVPSGRRRSGRAMYSADGRLVAVHRFDAGGLAAVDGCHRRAQRAAALPAGALRPGGDDVSRPTASGSPTCRTSPAASRSTSMPIPEPRDRTRVSSGGGGLPRWRADGRELYLGAPDRTLMAIERHHDHERRHLLAAPRAVRGSGGQPRQLPACSSRRVLAGRIPLPVQRAGRGSHARGSHGHHQLAGAPRALGLITSHLSLLTSAFSLLTSPFSLLTSAHPVSPFPAGTRVYRRGVEPMTVTLKLATAILTVALVSGFGRPAAALAQGAGGTPSQEGITIHGRWTIEVRNPDGSVASRHEFNNALVAGDWGGGAALAGLLGRRYRAVGMWTISLDTDAGACVPGVSTCLIPEHLEAGPAPMGTLSVVLPTVGSGGNLAGTVELRAMTQTVNPALIRGVRGPSSRRARMSPALTEIISGSQRTRSPRRSRSPPPRSSRSPSSSASPSRPRGTRGHHGRNTFVVGYSGSRDQSIADCAGRRARAVGAGTADGRLSTDTPRRLRGEPRPVGRPRALPEPGPARHAVPDCGRGRPDAEGHDEHARPPDASRRREHRCRPARGRSRCRR